MLKPRHAQPIVTTMLVCQRSGAGLPGATLRVSVSMTLLSMVLLSLLMVSTATSAEALPDPGDDVLQLNVAVVTAEIDAAEQHLGAIILATPAQRHPVAPEPTATDPLTLPAGRAFARTARAFLAPGLVTLALMIGFGLTGRVTSPVPMARPKLDDDLRSFS